MIKNEEYSKARTLYLSAADSLIADEDKQYPRAQAIITLYRTGQIANGDAALKRFKKECQKAGIPAELRRREFYEKPSVVRKRKVEAAKRKARRRMLKIKRRMETY